MQIQSYYSYALFSSNTSIKLTTPSILEAVPACIFRTSSDSKTIGAKQAFTDVSVATSA